MSIIASVPSATQDLSVYKLFRYKMTKKMEPRVITFLNIQISEFERNN